MNLQFLQVFPYHPKHSECIVNLLLIIFYKIPMRDFTGILPRRGFIIVINLMKTVQNPRRGFIAFG